MVAQERIFELKGELDLLRPYQPVYPSQLLGASVRFEPLNFVQTSHFIDEVVRAKGRKHLVLCGFPGSGKSRYLEIVDEYMRLKNKELTGEDMVIGRARWEEAEDLARIEGKINTYDRSPFKRQELFASSHSLRQRLHYVTSNYSMSLSEVPTTSHQRVINPETGDVQWLGRELGGYTLHKLAHGKGRFEYTGEIKLYALGFVGGPILRGIVPAYRDANWGSETFEEAEALAIICGIEPPKDEKSWRKSQQEGASVEQNTAIRNQVDSLRQVLEEHGNIQPSQGDPSLMEYGLMEHCLSSEENLNLPPDRRHIVLNDPNLNSNYKEILEIIVATQGRVKISQQLVNLIRRGIPENDIPSGLIEEMRAQKVVTP